jgi:hypothetical protein
MIESVLFDIFLESVLVAGLESKISARNINYGIFGSFSKLKLWGFLRKIIQGTDFRNMIFFYTTKQHKIMQVSGINTLLSVVSEKNMIPSKDFCIVVFESTT